MTFVVLGLGSNLGNSRQYIRQAIQLLRLNVFEKHAAICISGLYESDALLPDIGLTEIEKQTWHKPFLNTGVAGITSLSPVELLDAVKKIENKLGRQKRTRWAPREIDIDILLYGDQVIENEFLTIPHKELLKRPFATLPCLEVLQKSVNSEAKQIQSFLDKNFSKELEQVQVWKTNLKTNEPVLFQTKRKPDGFSISSLVGVLNVTPDSFSDGGMFFDLKEAERQAQALLNAGAEIIDIGAESTRPQAKTISPEEEWDRLEPVLSSLFLQNIPVSLDTRNEATVRAAFSLARSLQSQSLRWINDVTGFDDALMLDAVKNETVDLVFMHHLGIPPSQKNVLDLKKDTVVQLLEWAEYKIKTFEKSGINKERLIFDPGIGFGKTPEQNLEIIQRAHEFKKLGVRILIGHSRKSFLSILTKKPAEQRDVETVSLSLLMNTQDYPPDYLRVHNIEMHDRAFTVYGSLNG